MYLKRMITFELPGADIKKLNIREGIQKIKEIGAEIVVIFANSYIEGYCYYPSKFAKLHPDLSEKDLFKEILDIAHKEKLKVYAYLNAKFNGRHILKDIPGSQCIRPDGSPIGINNVIMMCISSPFAEYFKKLVQEVCVNYPIEGIYIDESSFQTCCTCKWCKEKFQKEFNAPLPLQQDWDKKLWKNFLRWRYKVITDFNKKIYEAVKSINRDIECFFQTAFPLSAMEFKERDRWEWRATMECSGWHTSLIYAQDPQNFKTEDIVSIEDYRSAVNQPIWWIGATLKYINSISSSPKSNVVLLEYPNFPWLLSSLPLLELKLSSYEALANQGSPWFAMYAPGIAEEKGWESIKEVFYFMDENEKFFSSDFKSLSQIALIYSHTTADLYGRNDAKRRYIDCFMGFYKALMEEHFLTDVVSEEGLYGLDYLKRYKVLCLPNTACLDDIQLQTILNYVKNGGKVLLSYETSFFDKEGTLRKNIGLKEMLKVDFTGSKVDIGAGYFELKKNSTGFRGFKEGDLIPYLSNLPQVKILNPEIENCSYVLFGPQNIFAPVGERKDIPSVLAGSYGKGRFIYLLGKMGVEYFSFEVPEAKKLIIKGIETLLDGEKQPILVEAPSTVEVTAFFNVYKKCMRINLVNHTFKGNLRAEEIVPVQDIKLTVLLPLELQYENIEAFLLQKKGKISFKRDQERIIFFLSELDVYEAIIIKGEEKHK